MTRLELLQHERSTVSTLRCAGFDAKGALLDYYDKEIAAIKEYGASNPEVYEDGRTVSEPRILSYRELLHISMQTVVEPVTVRFLGSNKADREEVPYLKRNGQFEFESGLRLPVSEYGYRWVAVTGKTEEARE
ncbi:MAG: hypothetical protein RSB39_07805 [Oscillospiraceae bacterium]